MTLSAPTRFILVLAVMLGGSATMARGADTRDGTTIPTVDPLVHSQASDRYVNGRYDKTGTYIPPHYQPVAKPRFHGYFFNKEEGGKDEGGGDKAQKPN